MLGFFDPRQLAHAPASELHNGGFVAHAEKPSLAKMIAAAVPGLTRVYLNQHWASDIVSGAFIGTLLGTKVVRYGHTHRRSKVDQFLLGTTIVPLGDGRVAVAVSLPR